MHSIARKKCSAVAVMRSQWVRGALLSLLLCSQTACAHIQQERQNRSAVQPDNTPFSGAWTVKWCGDQPRDASACGGFTAYLVQTGDRVCGRHLGADDRANRFDEGERRSIVGVVSGRTATLVITSARNGGVYLARAYLEDAALKWEQLDVIRKGENGEPAFIPDSDALTRSALAEDLTILETIESECQRGGR